MFWFGSFTILNLINGVYLMEILKQRIITEGRIVGNDILKVDSFLNHQIDVVLLNEIGREFRKRFSSDNISKILTIEASGIGIACIASQYFNTPVVFAKKSDSIDLENDTYESEVYSFTKGKKYKIKVSKRYISNADRILIIDDFLANGHAVLGLKDITDKAGAMLEGVGIVIEKGFQDGGRLLRGMGIRVESLAIIKSMDEGRVLFS
jgi:xanthine phosphoribosyltransferase